MGIRFQKRISIIPGVRLNLGMRGISASVGPRGASLSVGRRGVFANLGIPGTGLSHRRRLGAAPRSSPQTAGMTVSQLRAYERDLEVEAASIEHQRQSDVLEELTGILRSRVREVYDWNQVWGPRGVYPRVDFVPPARNWSEQSESRKLATVYPIWRWALPCALAAATTFTLGDWLARLGAVAIFAATGWWVLSTVRMKRRIIQARSESLEAEYQADLKALNIAHDEREAAARDAWLTEERTRERIRTSIERQDCEALALILEHELQNEVLPFPFTFDVEMDQVDIMSVRLALPGLDVIPESRTSLTKRGRLSTRAMTQRDRVGLYTDVCASLALRLANEAFRVLPCLRQFILSGETTRSDPSTGHLTTVTALHFQTSRDQLGQLNLDSLDPSSALTLLNGRFACDRRGELGNLFA